MDDTDGLTPAGRWFDATWYLARNPDVAQVGIEPMAHYRRYGESEGRQPSPWFDPAWYRAAYDIPDDQSPLDHFLAHRDSGAFLPSTALYLVPRSDPWRGTEGDPFDRYLTDMETPERELLPDLDLLRAAGLIDAAYFDINPTDPFERELDPVLHYRRFGWWRGFRPSTGFDPEWYAETNDDVRRLRLNPLTHYILEGEAADRRPAPWFDPAWYRSRYEVPSHELALAHYLRHRLSRTVSPNPLFDLEWYLRRHAASIPDSLDPFSHFLLSGALRDVDPSPSFSARDWRHRHMAPLAAEGQSELPIAARNPLVHYLRLAHAAK